MSADELTDTQLVLLSAAAQHPEGAIELASDLKGGAASRPRALPGRCQAVRGCRAAGDGGTAACRGGGRADRRPCSPHGQARGSAARHNRATRSEAGADSRPRAEFGGPPEIRPLAMPGPKMPRPSSESAASTIAMASSTDG